ncbi:hypothetical protein J2848_001255 [Azospirillum lipoferum]|uniref:Uncharacterized protein n=1 Tax=Azospirillum lipoferum TaxID=193 RepID=A0A5A9GY36_AZOLI|nr:MULTISPECIES: hypothetical protein [Azospirillum]KAA0598399.1 hypothetical protein FZ942_04770 [Azospirillum lipoferum]MCP1609608.1 hypothetical protein [Azospirillum lipoferum]MDW5535084.1 hypothetical protein [Azospirillum sp. NL1]
MIDRIYLCFEADFSGEASSRANYAKNASGNYRGAWNEYHYNQDVRKGEYSFYFVAFSAGALGDMSGGH